MAGEIRRDSIKYKILTKLVIVFNSIMGKIFGIVLCNTMMNIGRKRSHYVTEWYDFVRCSSLELAGKEIYENNIPGAVAELGVFRGDFAKFINMTFPDRKLYLFDTFEGFDERDLKREIKEKFSPNRDNFENTSVKIVLRKMAYQENCIVKQGFFPETARNLEERYAFVSLDVDLYEPIYNGLKYFYPRLEKGGYLFVHDYNNKEYTGTREAVKRFSREYNVSYFPLTDINGSAVFVK